MSKFYQEIILNSIGTLFTIIGFLAVMVSFYYGTPEQIFWMCYVSLFLMGVAILSRNSLLLASQLNIMAIPLILWSLDFFNYLANGRGIFGFVDYFFIY